MGKHEALQIGVVRASGVLIESAEVLIRSGNRRALGDPECVPVVQVRAKLVDFNFPSWRSGLTGPLRQRLILDVDLDAGSFTRKGVKLRVLNAEEILVLTRAALGAYLK